MEYETKRLEELRIKIIQWADDKGILSKATPEKQFLKFMEETGELAKAILKSDSDEFIDAVGDVFVTIVIHAELRGEKVIIGYGLGDFSKDSIAQMASYMNNGLGESFALCALRWTYSYYQHLSNDHSFADCVDTAYDVIAGRTGEMINGTFVKDK